MTIYARDWALGINDLRKMVDGTRFHSKIIRAGPDYKISKMMEILVTRWVEVSYSRSD